MTHEEIQTSLPDLVAGRLSAATGRSLESHVRECDECAAILSDLRTLQSAIERHGEAMFDEHPELQAAGSRAKAGSVAEEEAFDRHRLVCASCALEVAPVVTGDRPSPHTGRRLSLRMLEAAALIFVGLLLGLLIARVRDGSTSAWEGPIDLPVLERTTRGREPLTRILIRPGQSSVVLAIPVDLDAELEGTAMVRLTVLGPAGETVLALLEPAAWYRAASSRSGIVPISIRSERLPAGTCRVVIAPAGAPAGREAVLWFQVVRGEPHVTN